MTASSTSGIAALGLAFPSLALPVERLAELRGVDPAKYSVGLGCKNIALCAPDEDAVTLAVRAAERALQRWGGDRSRIGLIAVGTETAKDMSRPLSAFVAEKLGLSGAMRSYEVKHACYGGTLALRQALEWRWSGAAGDKAALVIASDVALYALEDGGEPTQGAGAVAMIVDRPLLAQVGVTSHTWAEPAFDFYRPVGQSFPSVDGPLSLDCYVRAASNCFRALRDDPNAHIRIEDAVSASFHVPFPKMVAKAVRGIGDSLGWDEGTTAAFLRDKVEPSMGWNREVGNCYTASTWISLAQALAGRSVGTPMLAFSYGSGFGSELLTIRAGELAAQGAHVADVEADLAARRFVTGAEYAALRAHHVGVK